MGSPLPTSFSPKRILVCQLRQLGDVILATPALALLHKRFPDAEVHVLTEKKCATLLEHNPHVHTLWAIDKKKLNTLYKEVAWYWHVARQGFDMVVDFQQLPRCRWVVAFSGAPVRLSYTPPWYTKLLYTHGIPPKQGYAAQTKVSLLAPFGIAWQQEPPQIYLTTKEQADAQNLLTSLGLEPEHKLITLDPTHRRATRRWPIASYARFIEGMCSKDPCIRVLPLWGPGEEKEIAQLVQDCQAKKNIILPKSMLSLREMAAVIEKAHLHVGNCSAPRHMAVAVGVPTCVVHGSTGDEWAYPSPQHVIVRANLDCQPCELNQCPRHDRPLACLVELEPDTVVEAALRVLQARIERV